jgi:membrane associated rhomboid family serine protease
LIPLKDNLPTSRFAIVTVVLVAINAAVFVWQLTLSGDPGSASSTAFADVGLSEKDQVVVQYGAVPKEVTDPGTYCIPRQVLNQAHRRGELLDLDEPCGAKSAIDGATEVDQAPWWLTILTSMFMHADILHIAGNMLFLWVFGNNIEDAMGRPRFVAFYLLGGVVAVYAQALLDPGSTQPTIGASGAVAGVLGGYALLHPGARVLTLIFIIFFVTVVEIPAMVMLGIWFVLQFLPAVGQLATPEVAGEGGGVAYFAHVGGFIFGLALIKLFAYRRRESPPAYPAY